MSDRDTTRRQFVGIAGGVVTVSLAGCASGGTGGSDEESTVDGDGMEGEATESESMGTEDSMEGEPTAFTVRIENVASTDFYGADTATGGGIWVTPGVYAVHTGSNPIHAPGAEASPGLEALAEAGLPTGFPERPGLVGELQDGGANVVSAGAYTPADTAADPNDPTGEVPGAPPIAPGGAFEFEVEGRPGDHLALASMFVPSNDLFLSPGAEGIPLWTDGSPVAGDVTDAVSLWDAGTEPNAEPPGEGPDQAPAQESPDQGDDEDGVVRAVSEVDDGNEYPAASDVVRVTVRPAMEDGGSMTEDGESTG